MNEEIKAPIEREDIERRFEISQKGKHLLPNGCLYLTLLACYNLLKI